MEGRSVLSQLGATEFFASYHKNIEDSMQKTACETVMHSLVSVQGNPFQTQQVVNEDLEVHSMASLNEVPMRDEPMIMPHH